MTDTHNTDDPDLTTFMELEHNLDARSERVQKMAKRIHYRNPANFDEYVLTLKLILSRHYNIPLFNEYFEKRTLDELWLECEFIRLSMAKETDNIKDILNNPQDREEIEKAMFGDLFEDGEVPFEASKPTATPKSIQSQPPPGEWITEDSTDFDELSKKFMQTGNFIGE